MNRRNFFKALLVVPAAVKAVVTAKPEPVLIGCDVANRPDRMGMYIVSTNPSGQSWFYEEWVAMQRAETFRVMGIPAEVLKP